MPVIKDFIKRRPVLIFFALTFSISWGGFVLVVGPRGFPGTSAQFEKLLPFVAWAMLAGPGAAGLALTGFVYGGRGLRELLSGLLRWRVGAHWYAIALLPAPILASSLLRALSISADIFTAEDKIVIILSGVAAGLSTVFEEIGWTGFAVPKLRERYSIFATGLVVGVLWGAWHLLQTLWVGGIYSGSLSLTLFLPLSFLSGIAQLTAYRLLLVWVYEHTGSLIVTTLMHASLSTSTVFVFRPRATGVSFLTYTWGLAAAFWAIVAVVMIFERGSLDERK